MSPQAQFSASQVCNCERWKILNTQQGRAKLGPGSGPIWINKAFGVNYSL